jgi:acetylornithine deacetylase/succinyl-diaminopimelate desuccinylase-like protein
MGNHLVATELVRAHNLAPAAVLIAVSSNNQLCLGNLGRLDVHVSVHGKSAHSSSPANGINALDGARRFLNNVAAINVERCDPELGQPTLTPIVLETSPRAAHTIPSLAEITLDCRLIPGDDIDAIVGSIRACAEGLEPCRAEVRVGHINYPNKVAPDREIARSTMEAMLAAGLPGEIVYKRSALDAGYFTRLGFDSVVFGPGDPALAHADEERVEFSDVLAGAEAYQRICHAMCGA